MMDIPFNDDELLLRQMQETFNKIPEAIYMDHYELSKRTDFSSLSWKNFFTDSRVCDWLAKEMLLIQQSKLRLLIRDIDSNTKSTGLPQLINTLTNQIEDKGKNKDGPIFIYTYVPLNKEEEHAPNVQKLDKDITIKDFTDI